MTEFATKKRNIFRFFEINDPKQKNLDRWLPVNYWWITTTRTEHST